MKLNRRGFFGMLTLPAVTALGGVKIEKLAAHVVEELSPVKALPAVESAVGEPMFFPIIWSVEERASGRAVKYVDVLSEQEIALCDVIDSAMERKRR